MMPDDREIVQQLTKTYLRGFRDAVALKPYSAGLAYGAYAQGFSAGQSTLRDVAKEAKEYAKRVLASPAVAQARRNASSR
jgi:hypothetical protein